MSDFEGKVIKVYLNSTSGWVCECGPFIKMESDFLVIENKITKKIRYISMVFVKTVEILGDMADDNGIEYEE